MLRKFTLSILLSLSVFSIHAQVTQIKGFVFNEEGEPLEDSHIYVKETGKTSITDATGAFILNLEGYEWTKLNLIVTNLGYETIDTSVEITEASANGLEIVLRETVYDSGTMVVTATRTRRDVEEVSIPVTVVSNEEISRSGSMRLSDVLSEQTGMQIVNDHGTGIQVQGFDPDYTLIMIDGNPVIGRTAGTLDLSRLSVRNVEQVEIVKGPSSALWGSDALAGVINIITSENNQPVSAGFTSRYGANNTLDLGGDLSLNSESWSNDFFVNRNSSSGYSLNSETVSQTVPEYQNYTLSYKTSAQLLDDLSFEASARYFNESQNNQASISDGSGSDQLLESDSNQNDASIKPSFNYTPFTNFDVTLSWLFSHFETESKDRVVDSGELYSSTNFKQYYNKPEFQTGYYWNDQHHSMVGGGLIMERLDADRYPNQPDFTTQFIFTQHSWMPTQNFELTGGFRFDAHSEYTSQFSPKLSSRFKMNDWIQFRASAGRGFKAPEFRQLFLDFTNSTAGYSVFGSSTVVEGIRQMQEEGTIGQVLIPLESLDDIEAESSWAFNFGFDVDPVEKIRVRFNLFRNNVTDLIETAPVAQKTNGQSVFTYFNVDEVFTQGLETEVRLRLLENLTGSVGYQLLDANRRIERERTVQNEEGEVVEITEVSYRPMFNRSKHSGNVKLFYEHSNGWGANVRGTLRGKYGRSDSNGNGYVDSGEYEDGYTIWNAAISKRFDQGITLRSGVDNVFGYTNSNQPNLSGSLWYAQVSIEF